MTSKFILFVFVNVFCSWQHAIGGPTINPADPFDAEKSAEIIWKAVKGCGTDEDDINKVLCKIPFQQRNEIAIAFEAKHGKKLVKRLEDETSGDLKKMYGRLLLSPQAIMAIDLHETIDHKRDDDEGIVAELICGTDEYDKGLIGAYYLQTYNMNVTDHLKNYKKEDALLQSVLYDFCWRAYCPDPKLDAAGVLSAAQALAAVDPKTDCDTFRGTLQTYFKSYCLPDLKGIFAGYRSCKNRGINEAIRDAMKGDEADAWVALTLSIEVKNRYYANLLYQAVDGCGTHNEKILRIVLSTCERNLGDIDCEYKDMHRESFLDRLNKFWGGDDYFHFNYKDCMKKLFGK